MTFACRDPYSRTVIKAFTDQGRWTDILAAVLQETVGADPAGRASKLTMLDNAQSIRDLEASPGNELEKLKGGGSVSPGRGRTQTMLRPLTITECSEETAR